MTKDIKTPIVFILALFAVYAQSAGIDHEGWLSDFTAMKQMLERRYSNLAWFGSIEGGVDLPALEQQTLASLTAATSDQEAQTALLNFVRGFRDSHFYPIKAPRPKPTPKTPDAYSREDAEGGCRALDYGPVRDWELSMPFDFLPGFNLIADGNDLPFRAGIFTSLSPKLQLGIVRIPEFVDNYHALCLRAWGLSEVWDEDGKLDLEALELAVAQVWYEMLVDLLRTFKTAGVTALLVDIGNNSGGNDSGDISTRLFTSMPLRSSSLWVTKDEDTSAAYFEEQITALREALELDPENRLVEQSLSWFISQKEKLTESCPLDWVWHERRSWYGESCRRLLEAGSSGGPLAYLDPNSVDDERIAQSLHWPTIVAPLWGTWTGPLYVLIDGKTYSSAEAFAAIMQNNGAAKLIGSQTGGDGCGSMNRTEPLVLPHSGLHFRFPNCVRLRADGSDEVAGVRPDISIQPQEGEDDQARAQRILDELIGDLKRSLVLGSNAEVRDVDGDRHPDAVHGG